MDHGRAHSAAASKRRKTIKCTCNECAKYTGGWCRYKGVVDPAAVKADRRSRLCKPVPKSAETMTDFGQIAPNDAVQSMRYGRQYKRSR